MPPILPRPPEGPPGPARRPVPARPKWRVGEAKFKKDRRAESTFSPEDKEAVERLADEPEGDLAAAIDRAVNNTSLLMVIEAGDQFLLFPGDAQWGTWKAILERPELCRLLQRTTALKVSHHGSHNGTPKALVDELLGQSVVAFVSTAPVARNGRASRELP